MKTSQKVFAFMLMVVVSFFFMTAGSYAQQAKGKPWDIPANFNSMKNPLKGDAGSVTTGKDLFAKHCKACHGTDGKGTGPKGAMMKTYPGDFTSAAFQGMSDGSLMYIIDKGRDEMPSYEKKIPEINDRWALVNYLRTFKK